MTGNGTISTNEVFLQGATARTSNKATPGKALEDGIKVTSSGRHIADGTRIGNEVTNDPLADLALWMTMLVLSLGAGLSIVQLTKKRER